MGTTARRRVETAERTSQYYSLCLLILLLTAAAPAPADDESWNGTERDAPATTADDDTADASATAVPVRAVGEVTATATRAERDVLDVAGNVTVIEREQIERSGAGSVPDLLRRQGGLYLTSTTTNPAGLQVESRGFANGAGNGSSLLVQVNGRRVNQPDSSVADWALIDIDEVESIEIVRGPASALYGDNAVGGVIDIRTRPAEGPPRASVRTRIGRYDSYQTSLKAAATVGPVTGSLFAGGLWTDGYRHGADFDHEDVNGSLQVDLWDRVQLGVSGGWYHDDRGFPGVLLRAELDALGRRAQAPDSAGTGSNVESRFVEGWIDAVLAKDVLLKIQPYYRWRDDLATNVFAFGAGLNTDSRDKSSLGVDTHIQVDVPVCGLRNRLLAGFDFLRDETDRSDAFSGFFDSLQDAENEKNVYAVFVQDELNLTDTLILSAGVRFDRAEFDLSVVDRLLPADRASDEPDYSIWSPKASVTWRFLPTASAYFSYARGFRLPNFDENLPTLTGFTPVIPDLDEQISDSFELGGTWRSERVDASIALYWMNVKDEIILNPFLNCFPGFGCFGQNDNFNRVRHRGVELGMEVQITEWLTAYANYTFEDVEVTEDGVQGLDDSRIPITPRHRGNLGIVARFPYDIEVTAHAIIAGERIVANDFDRQAESLDPYATLDLLLAWRPTFGEHVEGALTMALRNVNTENYDGLAVRSISDPSRVGFYPAAKLTWELGMMLTVRR
jgi:iron complex outermembrane receptor protein